jgi:acetolactate synthase-1/2/3 large subunit
MKQITDLLKASTSPVILAGHGIRQAKAEKAFIELIESLQIPVLTTWRAMDLIEHGHPLFRGRPGLITSKLAQETQDNCDLIICIGTRLDLLQVAWGYTKFASKAKKIVVDIDQAELDKLPSDWIKINAGAGVFINELYKSI